MVAIYTDGSCSPNPGRGGWAYVIPTLGIEKSGSEPQTTNNRMEMMAIIQALKDTTGTVQILTDSQLCIGLLAQGWKGAKNQDLIAEAKTLMRGRTVEFKWVRGHNGNQWNERADFLANTAVWSHS